MTDHDPSHDSFDDEPPHEFEPDPDAEHFEPPAESGVGSLAPIWARGVARLVDLFLVLTASSLLLDLTGLVEVVDEEVRSSNPVAALLVLLGLWAAYEVAGTLAGGRMIGKLVLGLRVRSVEVDAPPRLRKAVTRWLIPAVAVLLPLGQLGVLVVLGAVYLSALMNPQLQGFHDRAARTLVVRAR